MTARGDYVVSRLLGRPYLNKPPMHSWAIAAASGFDARRVGPLAVRLPSVLAVALIAAILWRLGTSSTSGPRALPALVFLTLGILPQYGRPGEIDLPFAALVTAALAAFEAGRRRGSPLVQWVASQGLVGAGILTKGFAPVFVLPPAALVVWRRGLRVRPWAVGLGLLRSDANGGHEPPCCCHRRLLPSRARPRISAAARARPKPRSEPNRGPASASPARAPGSCAGPAVRR
jgi:4-amino-4-deoxy-L-arabinose transferase-like glycosyltransferase